MESKVPFYRSIKTKLSVIVLLASLISLIVIGFMAYRLARYGMTEAGMGQIRDTLEGGYSMVEYYYGRVKANEMTKEEALTEIKQFLCGRIQEIWIKVGNDEDLKQVMALFKFEDAKNLRLDSEAIIYSGRTIAALNKITKLFVIKDAAFVNTLMTTFNKFDIDTQRKIVNSKYAVKMIYDFSKAAVKIRASGYVWAISGNPGDRFNGQAFEVFHPQIGNVNVWNAKNYLGELVGRKIGSLNGKIDTAGLDEIVRYDYLWKNPTDPVARNKIVLMKYFQPWNWVLCSGLYEDEFFVNLNEIRDILIIGTILAGIFSFLVTFLTVFRFVKQIKKLSVIAIQIANKNLTERIPDTNRKDELGLLTGAVKAMQENLLKILTEIMNAAHHVAGSASEISEAADHLARGSQTQMTSVEQASSAMTALAEILKEITDTTGDVSGKSKDLLSASEESKHHVESTMESMNKIRSNSQKISQILGVIGEISFQTNLLALNASVEAARAGEYGRGFAVVADEVSNLAKKSAEHSKKIEDLIKTNFDDVKDGTDVVTNAGKAFGRIIESVSENDMLIKMITKSVSQQREGSDEVLKAFNSISDVAHRVGAASEELAAATEELKSMAESIKRMFDEFKLSKDTGKKKKKKKRPIQ